MGEERQTDKERKICAVVREEYWITEDEQQFILAYRKADENIQHAVNRLLEVEEEFEQVGEPYEFDRGENVKEDK